MRTALPLLLLAACNSYPLGYSGVRPATVAETAAAVALYSDVAACLGVSDRSSDVSWWVVEELHTADAAHAGAVLGDDVFVREDWVHVAYIWAHESMHHALRKHDGNPDAGHDDPRWGRCANPEGWPS